MIVVTVELWSAVDRQKTELARMVIDNIGGTQTTGNYRARTLIGRSKDALDRALHTIPMRTQREGRVIGHARLREHVWNLTPRPALTVIDGGRGHAPAPRKPAAPWAIEFARSLARREHAAMMHQRKDDSP